MTDKPLMIGNTKFSCTACGSSSHTQLTCPEKTPENVRRHVILAMMEARNLQFEVPLSQQTQYLKFLAKPEGYKKKIRELAEKYSARTR